MIADMDEELYTLEYECRGEFLRKFSMNSIVVDGISGAQGGTWPGQMFSLKDDYYPEVMEEDEDGYLDDSAEMVSFEGASWMLPHAAGEIDEEAWLRGGVIRVK